ncbi:MAG: phosphatidate cytidylyltransferase [Tepidisphaerales bacterium]
MTWPGEVYWIYAAILAGILVVAGMLLSLLTWVLAKDVRPIWATYRSWLVMIPLAAAAIWAGRVPTTALFVLLSVFGFKEFARATGLYRDWWMTGAVYLSLVAVGVTAIVANPNTGQPGWYGLFMALPVYAIALFILIPILRNKTQGQLQAMALAILGFIYIGWMFLHLAFLAGSPKGLGYLLYLLFAVEMNDVAAFTFGRALGQSGKHLLRGAISPRKTWEGAIGALAVSMALPWVMRFSFPHFETTQLILTGLIVGIGGQLGDLSISVIKRDLGVKDMGATIPGHGGVLDRIDSLIYTAPLFMHMIDFYYKHW